MDRAAVAKPSWRDASTTAIVAGLVAVIVGYTSSAAIVFEAARAVGADEKGIASWMGALGLGMGVTCIALSLAYRAPILTAWSTPGAALLATSGGAVPLAEAIGAFVLCGAMLAAVGLTGSFDRLMRRVPVALAAAMLAGVLLRFGLAAVGALATDFALAGAMFAVYLAGRRLFARYAIPVVLATGLAVAAASGRIDMSHLAWAVARPVLVTPEFSLAAAMGLALPLFVVTMASQNVPGVATLRAAGYTTPASPLVFWTGATTVLLAPFGGYAFNLAAITAAICSGPEAHPDPSRRYVAAVAAGAGYLALGILGGTVGALLGAVPHALVVVVAGLALLGTIGHSLAAAVRDDEDREAAIITLLVTASGVTLAGIGSAFWGIAAGLAVRALLRPARKR